MNVKLVRRLGILGIVSLLSYTMAVIISPMAYPGYDWTTQAVSDLSAVSAPSRELWNQIAAANSPCALICLTLCCISVYNKMNRPVRLGIYLFTLMSWISGIGYGMFPLAEPGIPHGFQGFMHMVITVVVVLLSITSLVLIIYGGYKNNTSKSLGTCALIALLMMLIGAVGTGMLPQIFGIMERLSVFSAAWFTAVLGWLMYREG